MPPDLPEDPAAKEDSLFGRAPILSPVESIREAKDVPDNVDKDTEDGEKEPTDPLRDDSHDPLKDPSQLFAFVTKTPSPEKSKGWL